MQHILRMIKPYYKLIAIAVFAVVLNVFGSMLIPTISAEMINLGVRGAAVSSVLKQGLVMLGATVISSASGILAGYLIAKIGAGLTYDVQTALYKHSLSLSASEFERFGTGSMLTRSLNDVFYLRAGLLMLIGDILPVPIMFILGTVFTFRISSNMGFLLLGTMSFVIIIGAFIIKNASAIFEKLQTLLDKMNVILRETYVGVRVIRAFNKEGHEKSRLKQSFEEYATSAIRVNRLYAGLDSLALAAINICIAAIFYLGGKNVLAGKMEIGHITAVTEYIALALYNIVFAQMVLLMLPKAIVSLKRINEVLDVSPSITDSPNPKTPDSGTSEVVLFNSASLRYEGALEDALSSLSFSCRRGETTALIGGTGSGKSSVAKLLLRFNDVSEGSVLFGDVDIRDMRLSDLRGRISYIPQKAWLFAGTIADNLRFGDPEASDECLREALITAQAEFVFDLPLGLDTEVSQGGTNFSGGQRQRLAIARALVKKADLYIFDDSFSALDFKTDLALRRALESRLKDSAVLIIAQRVNTISGSDKIVVLDNGKICGIGKHDELMQDCMLYREIAVSQSKGGAVVG
ncbi:MAG: ABC transporter ATP-binding protein [Ruminococcaceae bacterium]|nr:ABC transporter ATP-binding protein [Oscillospiraceae bacterium]